MTERTSKAQIGKVFSAIGNKLSSCLEYARQKPFRATLWGIVIFFVFLNPWTPSVFQICCKVKNPDSPFFIPYFFSFYDYSNDEKLDKALVKMFPKGTSKEYVDLILVRIGGAEHEVFRNPDRRDIRNLYRYAKSPFNIGLSGFNVGVVYDDNNRLLKYCGQMPSDNCYDRFQKGE